MFWLVICATLVLGAVGDVELRGGQTSTSSGAIKATVGRRLLQKKPVAAATAAANVDASHNYDDEDFWTPNTIEGVHQSVGYFEQWVRFYFFQNGVFTVKGNSVMRYNADDNLDVAAKFQVQAVDDQNDKDKVRFGDQFRLRVMDGSDRFVYLAPNGNLMVGPYRNGDDSSFIFTMQVKHRSSCGLCIGVALDENEEYGQKLVHAASNGICGGAVGKPSVCGAKVGSWQNYELTMGG